MEKLGVSFHSELSSDEVLSQYIKPLRTALQQARAGIYSNHLRQVDPQAESTEHLLVFEVRDFKEGLRVLRLELERIGPPTDMRLHNLNPSQPEY